MSSGQATLGFKTPAWWAEAMLLLVAAVWGASYGLAKTAVFFYPVLGFLAVRFCVTALLLLPTWRRLSAQQVRTTLTVGLPLGLILLSIFVAETYGLSLTSASNAAFLISLCVTFTPFVEWIVLRAHPGWAVFVATGVSLVGTWLLTSTTSLSLNLGDGLMLIAALLRAAMVTCTTRLTRGKDIPSLPLTAVQTGTVGLGCLMLGFLVLPDGLPPLPNSPVFWYATGFLVVFCTLFAFFAQNYALRRISPTRVSLLMGAEPVFGALFAVWWLHESLGMTGWIGGLLIVGASLWAALRR
ncbi:DMT family transporter [Verminephrobacter aporrectodeae subsp. tuberculatae]|uniref:DMT family transporter n=1 Tax=Verminephrobacter aporrectodeae subsp. tuberculatae TaxID=1110392 RepID=A0ABT3KV01_9BURK|nr:DMT family transporter [Verminephrobacter aporrectodeae]MCW5223055.1 DMT family transporter [Verminephrobacter aporrectodeae subsp. tuberculatae]MCW5288519.1 DMT family transporter [Verminephrobacter aporrectodeae subsp. tuberculatae]MCW5322105.1 DMT family transporter [Verminephrobacter aporrectodeae subsp. tuberculatae]MCW8164545.1 DMT family transporter [Verminephrobacter aporrectodeae subsp. tuberculatae]MCW8170545.1 DMT family transporter [Verminephrobacter aporrectodeae subsp. tubercu